MFQSPSQRLSTRAGFSMVGMLITMVCMVVLFAILMTSLNKAVTGEKSQHEGTVRSFEDKMYLMGVFQSMLVHANDNKGVYIVPSTIARSEDVSLNTTANLFSAMVMDNYSPPNQLISGNEYSGYVEVMRDYDYTAYDPAARLYWDPMFKADLQRLSHVSFAHMPLCGERFEKQWRSTMSSGTPLIGNRGPKDGVNDANSYACGRDGMWRGHLVFGDGHIDFVDTPTPNGLYYEADGQRAADNMFIMESGARGNDAILGFTKTMSLDQVELQFD